MKKKKEFKKNCKEANATPFNCRWNWKNVDNKIGQIIIYDDNDDPVALWEESRGQLQMLIDEWDFRENQYLAVGITRFHRIIGVGSGVYNIAWMDGNNMFQSIHFDQKDIPADEYLDNLDELSKLEYRKIMDSTLEDELRELDEIFED